MVRVLRDTERCPTLGGRVFPVALPAKLRDYPAAVFARQGSSQDDTFDGAVHRIAIGIAVLAPFPEYDRIEQAMGEVFQAFRLGGKELKTFMHPGLPRDTLDYDAHVGDAQRGLLRQELHVVFSP